MHRDVVLWFIAVGTILIMDLTWLFPTDPWWLGSAVRLVICFAGYLAFTKFLSDHWMPK